ncbi:hypothetical protein CWB41_07730 [Methylovirgula ligni]|nr:hypothetical protein CWB41_07730 [Methylovirgula ligni]
MIGFWHRLPRWRVLPLILIACGIGFTPASAMQAPLCTAGPAAQLSASPIAHCHHAAPHHDGQRSCCGICGIVLLRAEETIALRLPAAGRQRYVRQNWDSHGIALPPALGPPRHLV